MVIWFLKIYINNAISYQETGYRIQESGISCLEGGSDRD